jgi:8-oxo-dGTP diphosphatase
MQERYKIIPACYLVLTRGNEVLLQLRKNTGFMDGKYSLVSGHLEGDETLKEAMIRETKEEAGVAIKPEDLELIHVMHRSKKSNDWERIDFFMAADKWEAVI